MGNLSQSYGASPAMGSHSVTWHRWAHPAGTRFTYHGRMESWVDLGLGFIPRWFTRPQTVAHPSSNYLITTWPGVKLPTFWSYHIISYRIIC